MHCRTFHLAPSVHYEKESDGLSCLCVGLYADYGEVIWDEHYGVPEGAAGDAREYPLSGNLILLVVVVVLETFVCSILDGERMSRSVTLTDFAVRPLEVAVLGRGGSPH